MTVVPLSGSGSRAFVARFLDAHHYLGSLPGWRAVGAYKRDGQPEGETLGLVIVGSPASRVLTARGYQEIRRLCVLPAAPTHASLELVNWAVRWASGAGWPHLIAYADPHQSADGCPADRDGGAVYEQAGFRFDGLTKDHSQDGGWSGRPTAKTTHLGPKRRFVRHAGW